MRKSDPALDELRKAYDAGNLIIFVGAGASAAAGLPTWKRLVELLAEHARLREADPAALAEIAELVAKQQYVEALSAAKDLLGAAEFCTVIEQHCDDRDARVPPVAEAIAALAPKLRAVLTTNLDHLLERAFGGRWPALPRATADIGQRRSYILKLHGTLIDRSTWVFTREEYDRATHADPNLKAAFTALFNTAPILFVGYGLADDDFDLILGRVRAFAGDQPPRHFALVSADTVTPRRQKRLEASGVRLIPYENADGKHSEVVAILRGLGGATPDEAPRPLTASDVQELLAGAGFPPDTAGVTPDAPRARRIARLLGCLGFQPTLLSSRGVGVAVGIVPGNLVVAIEAESLSAEQASRLPELSRALASKGGVIRLYHHGEQELPTVPGVEMISLHEALAPLVGDALRAHAQQCLARWTAGHERRYLAGQGRLPTGEWLPAPEAIDWALDAHRRVLLLGDIGAGKSTQVARRAALMAKAYLAEPERRPAPVLLPLCGVPPDLAAIAGRQLPALSIEALRLAVDLGMAVPLLDGLDELSLGAQTLEDVFASFLGAFTGENARAVFTSRKAPSRAAPVATVELQHPGHPEVESWLTGGGEPRAPAELSQRLAFARSLARRLFDSGAEAAAYGDIEQVAREVLDEPIDREALDLSAAAFLVADASSESFGFAHPSQLEYLLAVDIASRLDKGRADALDLPHLTPEIIACLAQLQGWEDRKGALRALLSAPYQRRRSENALLALYFAVRRVFREREALGEALDRELPANAMLGGAQLAGVDLAWVALRGADLTGADLSRARLSCADLRGARLDRAHAAHARFDGAALDGARMQGANLFAASFVDASLAGVEWDGADLQGVIALHTSPPLMGASAPDDVGQVPRAVLSETLEPIRGIAWSHDQRRLACAGGRAVQIFDAMTGALCHILAGHKDWVFAVAFSPDDAVASASADGDVRLWDALTGALQHTLAGHERAVTVLAFSPDGGTLASGSQDHTVRLWDVRTGALCHTFIEESGIKSLVFSPDGFTLAVAGSGLIQLLDVRTGALRHTLTGHEARGINSMAFSSDGSVLASGADDATVRLWDARGGVPRHTLTGHDFHVTSVAFSPDGNSLASASRDRSVRLWDVRDGALRHALRHTDYVQSVAFSPDGSTVASASDDCSVCLWDARTGARLHALTGHHRKVIRALFSPDGELIASAADVVRLWDVRMGALRQILSKDCGISSVAFSADGVMVSASDDGAARLWDARTGALCRVIAGQGGAIVSAALSREGRVLATGSEDRIVRLWDARTGALRHALPPSFDMAASVALAPDGSAMASTAGSAVHLWDTRTGALRHTLNGHDKSVWAVAFSADGTRLATASEDNRVRLWDSRSGTLLLTLTGHRGGVLSVEFSSDGSTVASSSRDRSVRLWDARTGLPRHELRGHENWVRSVAFSPNGQGVASGSDDCSIRLWDVATGQLRHTFVGHRGLIRSVAFSPDGAVLASAAENLRLWSVQSGRCLAILVAERGAWATSIVDTPLYVGGGDISLLLHFTLGARVMSADLWESIFQRPDLVKAALAGEVLDLAALGLGSASACEEALTAERARRGLIRRRSPGPLRLVI